MTNDFLSSNEIDYYEQLLKSSSNEREQVSVYPIPEPFYKPVTDFTAITFPELKSNFLAQGTNKLDLSAIQKEIDFPINTKPVNSTPYNYYQVPDNRRLEVTKPTIEKDNGLGKSLIIARKRRRINTNFKPIKSTLR